MKTDISELIYNIEDSCVGIIHIKIGEERYRGIGGIISPRGHIVTAFHNIEDYKSTKNNSLEFFCGGNSYPLEILSEISDFDLVVLKISNSKEFKDFNYLKIDFDHHFELDEQLYYLGCNLDNDDYTGNLLWSANLKALQSSNVGEIIKVEGILDWGLQRPGTSGGMILNSTCQIVGVYSSSIIVYDEVVCDDETHKYYELINNVFKIKRQAGELFGCISKNKYLKKVFMKITN